MSKKRVLIITTFQEFISGYSLTGIVKDQITMLLRNGHEVDLAVNEQYYGEKIDGINLLKIVPFIHLYDYIELRQYHEGLTDEEFRKFVKNNPVYKSKEEFKQAHEKAVEKTFENLLKLYKEVKYDIVFTHDIIFTGWNLPYGMGLARISNELKQVRFFHWVHSVPSGFRDYWNIRWHGRNSKLIFPNHTDILVPTEQFRGFLTDSRTIPHIKDIRTFAEFSKLSVEIIDKMPSLMSADIIQIYPASSDRLEAKGISHVISIFAGFKRMGLSVALLIVNQHATNRQAKESIDKYYKLASFLGLEVEKEFVFTSDIVPKYESGVPLRTIRELFMISNLLIFPTREESFGLIVPEAALTGNFLVLNRSLHQQYEVGSNRALFFEFGSYRHKLNDENPMPEYYDQISKIIAGRMNQNETIMTQMYARQRYNMDSLYDHYYAPLMAESETWVEESNLQNLIDKGVISVQSIEVEKEK